MAPPLEVQLLMKMVSVISSFHKKHVEDVPEKFIYFRPISEEFQEEIRRLYQQKAAVTSLQHIREEHSHPRTPKNLWFEPSVNAKSPGNDDLEVERSRYPFRERPITRRSWEALFDATLNHEGLHILKSVTEEKREIGDLPLPPEEENQAATSRSSQHLRTFQGPFPLLPQHLKLQRQYSHSLSQYSDIGSQKLNLQENAAERNNIEESSQKTILSASGEHPPINPSFENSSVMRGKLRIPGDYGRYPRRNVRVPTNNVIFPTVNVGVPMGNVGGSTHDAMLMDNTAVPLDNFEVRSGTVSMHNLEVPRSSGGVPRSHGTRIPMGYVESLSNSVGTSTRVVFSPLAELSKIGEHQV